MSYYQATIRIKNEPRGLLETAECTESEKGWWCERAKALATEHQQPIMLEFKPREEIIEFQPPQRKCQ